MSKHHVADTELTRRALIGAASVGPVLGGASLAANDTVAQCSDWIALDLEIERLSLRWSSLESLMAREHGWFNLTKSEQQALPEAAEMFEIDDWLEVLSRRRERLLRPLSHLPSGTLQGVASKLVIAARLLQHQEHPAQSLVADAVRDMADMRCPGCGAAHVPDGVNKRR